MLKLLGIGPGSTEREGIEGLVGSMLMHLCFFFGSLFLNWFHFFVSLEMSS